MTPKIKIGSIIATSGITTELIASLTSKNKIPQVTIAINAREKDIRVKLLYLEIIGTLEENIKINKGANRGKKSCEKMIVFILLVSNPWIL